MNNKGFMLAEVVIVSSIIVTMLVSMYVSLNKLLTNYNRLTTYYDIDTIYASKNELDYLIDKYKLDDYIYIDNQNLQSYAIINDKLSNDPLNYYIVHVATFESNIPTGTSDLEKYIEFVIRNNKVINNNTTTNKYTYLLVAATQNTNIKNYYGYTGIV